MRTLRAALGLIALCGGPVLGNGPEGGVSDSGRTGRSLEEARPNTCRMEAEAEQSPDLWYGTPGIRPGGDLLGPVWDLVRKPSGLLDFRPRKVDGYLPDRETAEFLRERR